MRGRLPFACHAFVAAQGMMARDSRDYHEGMVAVKEKYTPRAQFCIPVLVPLDGAFVSSFCAFYKASTGT